MYGLTCIVRKRFRLPQALSAKAATLRLPPRARNGMLAQEKLPQAPRPPHPVHLLLGRRRV
jgi:hypothetical protein